MGWVFAPVEFTGSLQNRAKITPAAAVFAAPLETTQRNAGLVHKSARYFDAMRGRSAKLFELVGRFRLADGGTR